MTDGKNTSTGKEFLKAVLDDIVEAIGLPKANRKSKHPLYRAYKYNDKLIEFGYANQHGHYYARMPETQILEPYLKIEIWNHRDRWSRTNLRKELIPMANPDYLEEAIGIINAAIGASMHSSLSSVLGKAKYSINRWDAWIRSLNG